MIVLILDRWVVLGTESEVVLTGVFWIVASSRSVGVEADEGVLGGSPVAMKVCWSICSGDSVCSSSGSVCDDGPAKGEGLAGRDEICLSLPKTFLGVVGISGSVDSLSL